MSGNIVLRWSQILRRGRERNFALPDLAAQAGLFNLLIYRRLNACLILVMLSIALIGTAAASRSFKRKTQAEDFLMMKVAPAMQVEDRCFKVLGVRDYNISPSLTSKRDWIESIIPNFYFEAIP